MTLTGSLEGGDRFVATLDAAAEALDPTEVNRREGAATLTAARIPRDTGYLESTATVTATGEGFGLTAGAPYAGAVHARDPFFLRAIQVRRDQIVQAHAQHVDRVLATIQGT